MMTSSDFRANVCGISGIASGLISTIGLTRFYRNCLGADVDRTMIPIFLTLIFIACAAGVLEVLMNIRKK